MTAREDRVAASAAAPVAVVAASGAAAGAAASAAPTDDLPRTCSLVLEGGVTSAVVYAGLIAGLAKRFERFEQLGGTSAGAVAAAFAALAERARRAGHGDEAFAGVADLPAQLAVMEGEQTLLRRLFQPQPRTRRSFNILLAGLAAWNPKLAFGPALRAGLLRTLREYPFAALLGALPGLALLFFGTHGHVAKLLAIAVALVGALVFLVLWALGDGLVALRRNHHGLCTGMPVAGQGSDAVTPYLHARYNQLLGRAPDEPPAQMAEVWGGAAPGPDSIDLQVITSVVTLNRPLRLPGEPGSDPLGRYFYRPDEWVAFFPAPVMNHLREHARAADVQDDEGHALRPMPWMPRLPVLVAVRMSLSFPLLFSALPMFTREPAPVLKTLGPWRRVYFSDGGLTSNCPVHLFDKPLPTNPTFAADLCDLVAPAGAHPAVWLDGDADALATQWSDPGASGVMRPLLSYLASLIWTAKDWRDNIVRELPGYAERVVNIGLSDDEGGLNLAMPPHLIKRLGELGGEAAHLLAERFLASRAQGAFNRWDEHRWTRLRTTLAALADYAGEVNTACLKSEQGGSGGYAALIANPRPPGDGFDHAASVAQAQRLLAELRALADHPSEARVHVNAPRPRSKLRLSQPW
jgi:Patatin-like phospholipase